MILNEVLGALATCLAVFGVLLNNRKMIGCFYVWLGSNSLTAVIHFNAGMIALGSRDLIFIILAIEGIWRWKKA